MRACVNPSILRRKDSQCCMPFIIPPPIFLSHYSRGEYVVVVNLKSGRCAARHLFSIRETKANLYLEQKWHRNGCSNGRRSGFPQPYTIPLETPLLEMYTSSDFTTNTKNIYNWCQSAQKVLFMKPSNQFPQRLSLCSTLKQLSVPNHRYVEDVRTVKGRSGLPSCSPVSHPFSTKYFYFFPKVSSYYKYLF